MPGKRNSELFRKLTSFFKKKTGNEIGPSTILDTGKYIFREGETPKGLFYVNSGLVKIQKEDGGNFRSPIVRTVKKNAFIGVESLILKSEYTSSAIVLEKAELQFLPKELFLELLHSDIVFATAFIESLCERIQENEEQIADLIALDARQRLATLLLSLAYVCSEKSKNDQTLINVLKKDIASMVGITPETLSRYLSEFEKNDYLILHEKGIELKDKNSLLRMSKVRD